MTSQAYECEDELVEELLAGLLTLTTPWGSVRARRDFYYQRGRTDVVAVSVDGRVLAFEAKLKKWRDAMHQAYRNLCFAHGSYVVLPRHAAERAERFLGEFARRGVGLCYIENGRVVILCESEAVPLQPWLATAASRHVSGPE